MNSVQRPKPAPSRHPGGRSMPASQANEKTASTTVGRMASAPILSGDYDRDVKAFSTFWLEGLSYLDGLPGRAKRSETQQADAAALLSDARQARRTFLGAHVGRVYRDLTDGLRAFRRIEELAILAGEKIPGLCRPPRVSPRKPRSFKQRKTVTRSIRDCSSTMCLAIKHAVVTFATRCCFPERRRSRNWIS